MNASLIPARDAALDLGRVAGRVPPLWPLQSFVAVNPYQGWQELDFADASAAHWQVRDTPMTPPASYFEKAWREGRLTASSLAKVSDGVWTRERLLALLEEPEVRSAGGATFAGHLDSVRAGAGWEDFVTDEVAKHLASLFDLGEAVWASPGAGVDCFAAWRRAALIDRNPEVAGIGGFREFLAGLPADAEACTRECLGRLGARGEEAEALCLRELYSVAGWASYLRFVDREAERAGRASRRLRGLLALRLCYDAALHWRHSDDVALLDGWRARLVPAEAPAWAEGLARWQTALELSYQEGLARRLVRVEPVEVRGRPDMQAVFCIDVRSETLRRHLEQADAGLATLGFAGFFGFPLAVALAGGGEQARCPVLVQPGLTLGEEAVAPGRWAASGLWRLLQTSAVGSFSLVETFGLAFAPKLGLRSGPTCRKVKVAVEAGVAPLEQRVRLAEGALKGMSLRSGFARLVLLCGHGSRSANNPHAAGLDCGACGGHSGDVNARYAAACLNDPDVRAALVGRGVVIPDDTRFVAGLHDTVTDEVVLFDEGTPASHRDLLARLRRALDAAGDGARRERAARQGLDDGSGRALLGQLRRRAGDPSQVRPEWGLANNAAFVAAPRSRTAGLDLEGRCFLHEYDTSLDSDGAVLAAILSAPVVVASWINLQYYASSVDPRCYGAGDKLLHNVTAGLGVVEGNGGDLRPGLPVQSLGLGGRTLHEPLRLGVYVEAPPEKVTRALGTLPGVSQLFENDWARLYCLEGGRCLRLTREGWVAAA